MKKIIKLIVLILFVSVCFAFGLVGCGEEEQQTVKKEIKLSVEQIALDIEQSYKLSATTEENDNSAFEYSIENENIAQITDNGIITAKRIGATRAVVKLEGYDTAYCEIIVALSNNLPHVSLQDIADNDIEVLLGTSLELHPQVIFGGNTYNDAEYSFSLTDASYGSFSINENSFRFNPAKTGEVKLSVTASWRGVESFSLTKEYNVVIKDNVYIQVNNGDFTGNVSLLTYAEQDIDELTTTQDFAISVYKNGNKQTLTQDNLSVVIADTNIATLSNEIISANNHGETFVTVTYKDGDISYVYEYPIKVERPIRDISSEITHFGVEDKLEVAQFLGNRPVEVLDAYQNDTPIQVLFEGGKYYITGASAIKTGVNQSVFTFYTEEKIGYKINVGVYGLVVKTPSDFMKIPQFADSSVILLNNLDMQNAGRFTSIDKLSGTINGNGFTVSNLQVASSGFAVSYLDGSVLSNISFVNMRGSARGTSMQCYLGVDDWRSDSKGLIQNVYLQTNMLDADGNLKPINSAIFGGAYQGLKLKNVIFDYPSLDIATNETPGYSKGYGLFVYSSYFDRQDNLETLDANWEDVFIISNSVNGNIMPVSVYVKHQNSESSKTAGYYGYTAFASNDLPEDFITSARNYVQANGNTFYFMYPTYKFSVDAHGKVSIFASGLNELTQEDAGEMTLSTLEKTGTVYVNEQSKVAEVGLGVFRMNAVTRFDSFSDFVTNSINVNNFDKEFWDVSEGYPTWKSLPVVS